MLIEIAAIRDESRRQEYIANYGAHLGAERFWTRLPSLSFYHQTLKKSYGSVHLEKKTLV